MILLCQSFCSRKNIVSCLNSIAPVLAFLLVVTTISPGIASAGNNPDLIRTVQGHQTNTITAVAATSDGRLIATSGDDGSINIWDLKSGKLLQSLGENIRSVSSLAFSPDGSMLAAGAVTGRRDHSVLVWDMEKGQLLHNDLKDHTQIINGVAFSPDGKRLVSVSNDNSVRIWNMKYGRLESSEKETQNNILSVAYSPDGNFLVATENWEGMIEMWDAVNVRLIRKFKGHDDWAVSCVYAPDGKTFVTSSRDGSVRVWDAGSGKLVRELREKSLDAVSSVVYSPDGRFIVGGTQSGYLLIWQAADGKLINFYEGHQMPVTGISFAGNKYLVSVGLDGSVRVWNGPAQSGVDALFYRAVKYDLGSGPFDEDDVVAAELYKQAAEAGQAEAQYRLGTMYSQGLGVAKDMLEARRLWEAAAGQGNQAAITSLAALSQPAKPAVVEKTVAAPVKELAPQEKKKPAAAPAPVKVAKIEAPKSKTPPPPVKKTKDELYKEGLRYFKGSGVAKNYGKAMELFKEAAEQGHAKAQYRIGFMYSLGKGVKRSDKEAVRWWEMAANGNDHDAQYYLGYMYEIGAGVKQDFATAKKWYQKAAANGNINAAQSLKMLP